MLKIKLLLLAAVFILLSIQTGCWDQRDIEERASIMAFSFDKGENENEYKISVQIPVPVKIAGGGGGGSGGKGQPSEATRIITVNAKSFSDAQRKIQRQVNYDLFYGHTRALIFSHELDKKDFRTLLNAIRNKPEIRRSSIPIVVKNDEAISLLKFSPKLEQIPMVYLTTMIDSEIKVGRLPENSIGTFFIDLSHPAKEPRMITLNVDKDKVSISGLALFKDYSLLGYLANEGMDNWLRVYEQKKGDIITVPTEDEGGLFSISPRQVETDYTFHLESGIVKLDIDIKVDGVIEEIPYTIDLNKQRKELEKKTENHLQEQTEKIISKAQNDFKTDIFNFGERLRAFKYRSIWKKIDWKKDFPNADISVNYHVIISGTSEMGE